MNEQVSETTWKVDGCVLLNCTMFVEKLSQCDDKRQPNVYYSHNRGLFAVGNLITMKPQNIIDIETERTCSAHKKNQSNNRWKPTLMSHSLSCPGKSYSSFMKIGRWVCKCGGRKIVLSHLLGPCLYNSLYCCTVQTVIIGQICKWHGHIYWQIFYIYFDSVCRMLPTLKNSNN